MCQDCSGFSIARRSLLKGGLALGLAAPFMSSAYASGSADAASPGRKQPAKHCRHLLTATPGTLPTRPSTRTIRRAAQRGLKGSSPSRQS